MADYVLHEVTWERSTRNRRGCAEHRQDADENERSVHCQETSDEKILVRWLEELGETAGLVSVGLSYEGKRTYDGHQAPK